jgi:hypothetical protein
MNSDRLSHIEKVIRDSSANYRGLSLELIKEVRRCHNVIESQQRRLSLYKACVSLKFPPKVILHKVANR